MIRIDIFNEYERGQYRHSLILSNDRKEYSSISAIKPNGTFQHVRDYYNNPKGGWYTTLQIERIN